MITGSLVALVTPMLPDGSLDLPAFRTLIDWHIGQGTDGLVIVGTTGESPTVNTEEHCLLIRVAVEQAAGRVPVIAGTGANSTSEAIELTECAKQAGATAGLSVAPYYNKPTQEGLFQHFVAVARAVELPVVLYNVPGRTAVNLLPETVARLAKIPGIVGIKEATGSLQQVSKTLELCGPEFAVLSGDDFTTLPLLAVGGVGAISVTANIIPGDMKRMIEAFRKGDLEQARRIHYHSWPLHEAMFLETNPIPVKAALAMMGKVGWDLRLPLTPLSDPCREKLQKALRNYGLL